MISIQRRLTRTLVFVVPALTAISGVIIYYTCRARLIAEFNQSLVTQTRAIGDSVMREGTGELEFYFDQSTQPDFGKADKANFYEIWRKDGSVYQKSLSLGQRDLPKTIVDSTVPQVRAIVLDDETEVRAAVVRVVPHLDLDDVPPAGNRPPVANESLYLVVARDAGPLSKTLATIWSALFWSGIALMTTIVGTVAVVVRLGLAPLRKLANEADGIHADSLHQRLSQHSLPEELTALSQKFNELLNRLEGAFNRERSFASAAAHELRTPIAELRALAEVALRWPEDTDAQRGFQDSLYIAQRMERLVGALLAILRTEAKSIPVVEANVDMNALVVNNWQRYDAIAHSRQLSFSFVPAPQGIIRSEPLLLGAMVDNLLSNAAAHTPVGGEIKCRLEAGNSSLNLTISNSCADLNAEDLPRLFEPFWRKDESRTGGQHFGLGLSLVATYATALQLPVKMQLQQPDVFSVTVGPMRLSTMPVPEIPLATG